VFHQKKWAQFAYLSIFIARQDFFFQSHSLPSFAHKQLVESNDWLRTNPLDTVING